MKNILYIGEEIVKVQNGGDVINLRNTSLLKSIYMENFHIYPLKRKNKISTLLNLFWGNMGFYRQVDFNCIVKYIEGNNINEVFLWSSKLGKLAYLIKKKYPQICVYVFFHNVEKQYYIEELKINKTFLNIFLAKIVNYNEKLAVKYSDKLITLNKRDSLLLEFYYNKNASFELPTSFVDQYDICKAQKYIPFLDGKIHFLFVGFNFFANKQGVQWFIDNIMPEFSNAHLTVVGKNMNLAFVSTHNITIHGYVNDLADYYYNTDIVVQPIFYGGGMKTKTAEALMYGCPIIGTTESFEGYELDFNKVGGLANNKIEMVNKIKEFSGNVGKILQARKYARDVFKLKYDFANSVKLVYDNLYGEK